MAVKYVDVADVGRVALYRRKGVRSVRMSIAHDGSIRVTLPQWAPYRLGIEFVRNKSDWISEKRVPKRNIEDGDRVGKAHRFVFEKKIDASGVLSRLVSTDIRLSIPASWSDQSPEVQAHAERAAVRALKKEAAQLLPQRLESLARQHDFSYNSVGIKRLKSRWGSCNERQDVVLNCFLMQLPWHLIDYVLLHELVHTKVLRHGAPFWTELGKYVKNLPAIRKEMKLYQPSLETRPRPAHEATSDLPLQLVVETY
jgi:predicted metal-dependent hydrolase